jgi:tyrosine-protein kinase Etk/Wzc
MVEQSNATPSTVSQDHNAPADRDDVNLLDVLVVLAKHKKVVLGFPVAAALIALVISLILPKWYTGVAQILPPQQQQSTASAMLSQLGSLANLVGGASGLGLKNPSDLYVGLLKSRTVEDAIIRRFDLLNLYDHESYIDTRKALERHVAIKSGKEGIIVIEVEDKDPKRSADMANAFVDELNKLTQTVAVTEASQRRAFFERQLLQAKDTLTEAEVAARKGIEKGGITQVDAQGRSLIEVTARLRAQISGKEIQIGAMRSFAAEGNPDLQRAQQELDAARHELARIEGSVPTTGVVKGEQAGQSGLENLSRLRNVKYYEYLYEFIARQFEIAKIDEAKEGTLVQVVDVAVIPDKKSSPRRALIVLIAALAAFIVAISFAFFKENLDRANSDPDQASRLKLLRKYLGLD